MTLVTCGWPSCASLRSGAETIPQDKKSLRQMMCLEESFCPFRWSWFSHLVFFGSFSVFAGTFFSVNKVPLWLVVWNKVRVKLKFAHVVLKMYLLSSALYIYIYIYIHITMLFQCFGTHFSFFSTCRQNHVYIYIYFVPKHWNNMKYKLWFNLTNVFVIIVDLHKSHKRN